MSSVVIETAPKDSFIRDLRFEDLQILRAVVRRAHKARFPNEKISDVAADTMIQGMGPQVAERMLKRAIDGARK